MVPVTWPITVYKGDTFQLLFRLRSTDEVDVDSNPLGYLDLTGRTPKAQVRSGVDVTEFTATLTDQTTLRGGVVLTLSPEQTAVLKDGVWDVQLTTADGIVRTYLRGKVKTVDEVTRV